MSLAHDSKIGSYRVLAELGAGGMGEVYLAEDTRLGRRVALKVLSANFTKNKDRVQRFQQEARSASALNHPNIITIYEIGQEGPIHFIATELIDGETLRRHISRDRLSCREVLDIALQVANALAAAHSTRIVHRDIKPENIMLRPDGYVKVLDFGLAKLTASPNDSVPVDPDAVTAIEANVPQKRMVETDPGTVLGTVTYMSPEQARGQPIDLRTDIFSLGVVIYEMVAGRVPFEGTSVSDVIVSILGSRPLPLARYSLNVPDELERIVSKALAKDREERYQTIKDLLIDLKKLKQRIEIEEELEFSSRTYQDRETVSISSASPASGSRSGSTSDASSGSGAKQAFAAMPSVPAIRTSSSAEYLITEIKRHKRGAMITVFLIAVAIASLAYFTRDSGKINSLAVMPFSNVSEDQSTKDLGNLLAQRIINTLSQMPELKVQSFRAVAQFNNPETDPQTVGTKLGVRAVLVGNFVKRDRDDGLFINLELVDARDNSQIWGKQYDRKFADLRRVQEEILADVSARLGLKMSEEEKREREAEQLYQEARNYWEKRTADGLKKAIASFERAIEIQPNYAAAYAGLADCYNMLGVYGALAPLETFPKAREAAERALSIDSKLAEAHTSLAFVMFREEWKWDEAENEFEQAIRLNPDYPQAHQWYANYLSAVGRHREAEQETRRVQELDPTSLILNAHFGFIYFCAHRYDDVITLSQKTLDLDPNFFAARRYLGLAYTQKKMYDKAINEYQKALQASGNSALIKAELAQALASGGKRQEAETILEELKQLSSQRYISPYNIALIYVALGEKEQAFEWLEKAFEMRADFLVYIKVDPRLDALHTDARFDNLVRRIGL